MTDLTGSPIIISSAITSPLGAGLLGRTQAFRDRVEATGGSIEDGALEGLYDPILRAVKDWGLLDDLVFFGSASAVENNSGSIATLFDASGNEHDAIQTDTAKRAVLNKNGIGGRWVADFDGTDDWTYVSFSSTADARTFFCVAEYRALPDNNPGLWGYKGGVRIWQQFVDSRDGDLWGRLTQENDAKQDFSNENGPLLSANTPFHTVQRADGSSTATQRQNGSQVDSISYNGKIKGTNDLMLGQQSDTISTNNNGLWDGRIALWVSFETHLSDAQVSEIENIYTDFYSI